MRPRTPTFPEGDSDEAVEFIDRMYPGQRRHLVSIPLKGKLEATTFHAHEDEEMREWIEARQGEANLYFHVNGLRPGVSNKKATKDDVSAALFIHIDIDGVNAKERLLKCSPAPTVIVFSGGGYHGYWKLNEPTDDLVRVEAINMAMVMGLIPVVGVPLPLISYGGTSMLSLLLGFGLVQAVNVNRDLRLGQHGQGDE